MKIYRTSIIKRIVLTLLLFACILSPSVHAADNLQTASDVELLQAACPVVWEKVDKALTKPTSVPWANEADRQKQIEFQRSFFVRESNLGSRDRDTLSRDVITVLSACIKRHNFIVDKEFKKSIGNKHELRNRLSTTKILQFLLQSLE